MAALNIRLQTATWQIRKFSQSSHLSARWQLMHLLKPYRALKGAKESSDSIQMR